MSLGRSIVDPAGARATRSRARLLARCALFTCVAAFWVDALAIPTCTVASGATLSFGTVVALASTGNVNANSGSTFWVNCTADVSAAPAIYSASARTLVSGGNALPFALSAASSGGVALPSAPPGTALGIARNGSNQTATLYGRIIPSDFKSLPSGSYTTTISLTVEY
ncbi:MAG: spore coat protein U domain-containing protein [Casimicrobiaceae bacterium]